MRGEGVREATLQHNSPAAQGPDNLDQQLCRSALPCAPFFLRVAISICFSFSISKFISLRWVVLEILALICKWAAQAVEGGGLHVLPFEAAGCGAACRTAGPHHVTRL